MIDVRERHSVSPHRGRGLFIRLIFVLMPVMLACTGLVPSIRPASERQAAVSRLPTFTRTPLPTFTPTPLATLLAMARVEEAASPGEAVPAAAQPLTNDAPDSAGESGTMPISPLSENSVATSREGDASTEVSAIENPVSASQETASPSLPTPTSPGATFPAQTGADVATPTAPSPTTAAPSPATLPSATATTAPLPTDPPTATPTDAPVPTDTPTPPPTATPLPQGWVFTNARISPDPDENNLLLYGDVINNTGTSQDLWFITGAFYDAQGQVIADENTLDYWPIETVPPGGQIPFELTVFGIQSAADFDLRVEAESSDDIPSQDFEFSDLSQVNEDDETCVSGKVRNLGEELQFYLSVVVVLYDGQDKVINFSDHYNHTPQNLVGDQTMDFKVCVDPLSQDVARYDVRAWGL